MFKHILILFLCLHLSTPSENFSNKTSRVERSDKVGATKMALATGLATLGQVALNQMGKCLYLYNLNRSFHFTHKQFFITRIFFL